MRVRFLKVAFGAMAPVMLCIAGAARADSVDDLKAFVADVKSARAAFTQVVSSPDGKKKRTSSGTFEFLRPNRFRFDYAKPYEQQIVADGQKVWLFDTDLNQVTERPMDKALGSTPAAMLAGGSLDKDFSLKAQADEGDLHWVQAMPKVADSTYKSLRVAFRGKDLAALEIVDAFGQRSRLDFSRVESNVAIAPSRFTFTPPAGAAVLKQ